MRKYQWLIIWTLIGGMVFFASCDRAQDMLDPVISEPKPPEVIEDAPLDTTALQNRLTIEGATAVGRQLPATSTAETAPRIQADVGEINASPGGTVSLPFAYSGTNALSGCIVCIEGIDGYFDLPYTGAPDALPSAISVSLPQNVALGSFTVCYSVYDDQGQTGNFINVVINVTEPEMVEPEPPVVVEPEPIAQYIYWTEWGSGKIRRANLDGSNVQDIVDTGYYPVGITIDLSGGKIYWTDKTSNNHFDQNATNRVVRANLDGSDIEVLFSERNTVDSIFTYFQIVLDPTEGKIYWSKFFNMPSKENAILRANLDGTNVEEIITGGRISAGLTLDLSMGKLFLANCATERIQRANLDGSDVEDIIVITGPGCPLDIEFDVNGEKVYWVEPGGRIHRADIDGSSTEELASGISHPHTIVFDSFTNKIYWTAHGDGSIHRANHDGSNIEVIISGLGGPVYLALDVPSQ